MTRMYLTMGKIHCWKFVGDFVVGDSSPSKRRAARWWWDKRRAGDETNGVLVMRQTTRWWWDKRRAGDETNDAMAMRQTTRWRWDKRRVAMRQATCWQWRWRYDRRRASNKTDGLNTTVEVRRWGKDCLRCLYMKKISHFEKDTLYNKTVRKIAYINLLLIFHGYVILGKFRPEICGLKHTIHIHPVSGIFMLHRLFSLG